MMQTDIYIGEIANFIAEQKYSAPFFKSSGPVNSCYKKFFAVLLQRLGAHKTAISEQSRIFLDEAASDLSYAFYLTALGFYKPARLCLRGSIENVLRYALDSQGLDPKPLSISQMFDAVKVHAEYAPITSAIVALKSCYSKLCKSSHTIDIQFMAHKIPFSELVESDKTKFDSNLSDFAKVSSGIAIILYVASREGFQKLTPEQQDLVRIEIPNSIKKSLLDGS